MRELSIGTSTQMLESRSPAEAQFSAVYQLQEGGGRCPLRASPRFQSVCVCPRKGAKEYRDAFVFTTRDILIYQNEN